MRFWFLVVLLLAACDSKRPEATAPQVSAPAPPPAPAQRAFVDADQLVARFDRREKNGCKGELFTVSGKVRRVEHRMLGEGVPDPATFVVIEWEGIHYLAIRVMPSEEKRADNLTIETPIFLDAACSDVVEREIQFVDGKFPTDEQMAALWPSQWPAMKRIRDAPKPR